jgi:NADPH-dependent curcumin reductase
MRGTNRQWTVGTPSADPGGLCLTRGHFVPASGEIPAPADGEVLVRNEYFSPDPMNHAWVRGIPGKFDPLPVGGIMRGGTAGRIVASRRPGWHVGEAVTGFLDWADYSVCDGTDYMGLPLERVPAHVDLGSGLSALGMTGICAWIGLAHIGRPLPGDTVLVSGASGGIGSLAGQIAKLFGARAVGIAGGREKCALALERGFDAVIDYTTPDLPGAIARACPEGAHVFFDNVGGALLDAALLNMATGGRIVICGALAHYRAEPAPIFNHMQLALRSLAMQGFFYFNETRLWPEARRRLAGWLLDGSIRDTLDVTEGFDAVPDVAIGQFSGGVRGRKLVRIANDSRIADDATHH